MKNGWSILCNRATLRTHVLGLLHKISEPASASVMSRQVCATLLNAQGSTTHQLVIELKVRFQRRMGVPRILSLQSSVISANRIHLTKLCVLHLMSSLSCVLGHILSSGKVIDSNPLETGNGGVVSTIKHPGCISKSASEIRALAGLPMLRMQILSAKALEP